MKSLDSIIDLLCDPVTKDPLELITDHDGNVLLRNVNTHVTYKIKNGIVTFVNEEEIDGLNEKYQKLYDRIAPFYNLANKVYKRLKFDGERSYRNEFLQELELNDGDRVIEISCGTGDNFQYIDRNVQFYGLDLSWGMLKACKRHLKSWKKDAKLFHGNAEELPFRDNTFDVVFHVGGINFFNDISKALREMVRIAKPGSKLMIVDENEEHVKNTYENIPFIRRYFSHRTERVDGAVIASLLPQNVTDIKLKDVCHKRMYCLTFRKC
jgi:ubiquinone/menaquinone biosynthesis C-methylase UbiE